MKIRWSHAIPENKPSKKMLYSMKNRLEVANLTMELSGSNKYTSLSINAASKYVFSRNNGYLRCRKTTSKTIKLKSIICDKGNEETK